MSRALEARPLRAGPTELAVRRVRRPASSAGAYGEAFYSAEAQVQQLLLQAEQVSQRELSSADVTEPEPEPESQRQPEPLPEPEPEPEPESLVRPGYFLHPVSSASVYAC